jgi:hypothetical protein
MCDSSDPRNGSRDILVLVFVLWFSLHCNTLITCIPLLYHFLETLVCAQIILYFIVAACKTYEANIKVVIHRVALYCIPVCLERNLLKVFFTYLIRIGRETFDLFWDTGPESDLHLMWAQATAPCFVVARCLSDSLQAATQPLHSLASPSFGHSADSTQLNVKA